MFQKIRRNFIIVSMLAVSFVLIISMATINIVNFHTIDIQSDNLINAIYNESKRIPTNEPPKPGEIGDNRYFVASINNNEVRITKMKVESISEQEALEIVRKVNNSKSTVGYYKYYRYNLKNNDTYVFLDCTNQRNDATRFLLTTVYSSLGGLLAVFLIIFFGSKIILKPVKESYDKQKKFITNASHSLKTPLTIISANNELIEMKLGESEYSNNISKEIDKMNTMVKELVNLSKMQEENKINKEKFNLSLIVQNTINEFKLVYDDLNLKLDIDIKPNVYINNDKEIIRNMIAILLDNARKYADKTIEIKLYQEKNKTIFLQKNDSTNIENGNLNVYFDRFYRSDNIRESREGSGIGLSILKELSEKTKTKVNLLGEDKYFIAKIEF